MAFDKYPIQHRKLRIEDLATWVEERKLHQLWLDSEQPPTTAPLRRLSITAKSTKLARLDLLIRGLGLNTLVKDIEGYRAKGLPVDWLVQMTAGDGDIEADSSTRLEQLCFLAEGSPPLRYIIYQLRDYVLGAVDDDNHPVSTNLPQLAASLEARKKAASSPKDWKIFAAKGIVSSVESQKKLKPGSLPKRESSSSSL